MKKNNKIYITLSVFTLISLFLIIFFIFPTLKDIEKNSQSLILARNNMAALGEQINETESFKKNYGTYEPDFKKIDNLFTDPGNPVDFIEFIENAAYDSKLTSQISLHSYQNSEGFIIFQVSCKGGFSGVLNFLEEMETGPYFIEIEDLIIQNSKDSNLKDYSRKVDANFTIKAFVKK